MYSLQEPKKKKTHCTILHQKVRTQAGKYTLNKTRRGGLTLFEPACPFRRRRIRRVSISIFLSIYITIRIFYPINMTHIYYFNK